MRAKGLAERMGVPLDEAVEQLRLQALQRKQAINAQRDRREFLKKAGKAAAGAGIAAALGPQASFAMGGPGSQPDVAVVGGGLAGLRAAHSLLGFQRSIDVRIYEGSDRLGGRCYSNRGFFADNMHAELGGQLINSEQLAIRQLCQNLGVNLEGLHLDESEEQVNLINGEHVAHATMQDHWVSDQYYRLFREAQRDAPWAPLYYDHGPGHAALDNMTVIEWLDHVGIGANTDFGLLMQSTQLAEYGLNSDEASALNLIYILAWNGRVLDPVEGSDIAWQIEGGNDTLVSALADEIGEPRFSLGKKLDAISGDAAGPYTLYFSDGSQVVAPKVILTLPHTKLREVDIDAQIWNAFSPAKQTMVNELGMAKTNKVLIQFDSKFYAEDFTTASGLTINPNGDIYTEPGSSSVNCAWDETIGQRQLNPSDKGIMVCYPSGERAEAMHSTGLNVPADNRDISAFAGQVDAAIPGAVAALTGGNKPGARRAIAANWMANEWSRGAYAAQHPGQWTSTTGAGEEVVGGNLHFAGEWTSVENGGFLEGAIESGERAAREVWQSI